MDYTHLILGFDWRIAEDGSPHPAVALRDETTNEGTYLPLTSDYEFNWVLSPERYCPGWMNFNTGEHSPCKFVNTLTNGYDLCPHCESQSGFRSAFFFGAEPNEHMQEFLKREQYVYLAFFQPDTVKVGTAVQGRERIRLIEQDALIGKVIAAAPGHTITKIEREISRALGLTEFVQSRQKFKYIYSRPDTHTAEIQLQIAHDRVIRHFEHHDYSQYLLLSTEVRMHNHSQNPHIFFPEREQPLEKLRDFEFLAGRYQGLRSKYLIVEHQGNLLVLNKRYIAQRKMRHIEELLVYPEIATKQPAAQIGLFG